MLAVAIVHLHHVIEGRVEEGELSKHHCGGRQCGELSFEDCVAMLGGRMGGVGGPRPGRGKPQRELLVPGANSLLSLSSG